MRAVTLDTPESMEAVLSGTRKTHFQLFDSPTDLAAFAQKWLAEKGEWCEQIGAERMGYMTAAGSLTAFRDGHLEGVAASDALLSKYEALEIATSRRVWRDDVTGAFPNVPAFIAGHPLNMRRRTRRDDEAAPIAIVVDLGTAANIEAGQVRRRGAAILALVRVLSARRPVELWAGSILDADNKRNSSATFCRLETAPIDLARAAFILTHPAANRGTVWLAAMEHGFDGGNPYSANYRHIEHTREIIAPAFSHVSDLLVLPRISSDDDSANDPEAWLEARLTELLPQDLAA